MPDPTPATTAHELRVVYGKLRRRLSDERTPGAFTPSELTVLVLIERAGSITISDLARAEGVRPQSMGATIASLEKSGLVQGSANPADGRQTLISLTDAAHARIAEGRAAREDWLTRQITALLTDDEQRTLAESLTILSKILNPA